jgi:hypothetical protein
MSASRFRHGRQRHRLSPLPQALGGRDNTGLGIDLAGLVHIHSLWAYLQFVHSQPRDRMVGVEHQAHLAAGLWVVRRVQPSLRVQGHQPGPVDNLHQLVLASGLEQGCHPRVGEVNYIRLIPLISVRPASQHQLSRDRLLVVVQHLGQEDQGITRGHGTTDYMESLHLGQGIGASGVAKGQHLRRGKS